METGRRKDLIDYEVRKKSPATRRFAYRKPEDDKVEVVQEIVPDGGSLGWREQARLGCQTLQYGKFHGEPNMPTHIWHWFIS